MDVGINLGYLKMLGVIIDMFYVDNIVIFYGGKEVFLGYIEERNCLSFNWLLVLFWI